MGARLVAASVPIYALAVAALYFIAPAPDAYVWWYDAVFSGLIAFIATLVLYVGAAAIVSARAARIAMFGLAIAVAINVVSLLFDGFAFPSLIPSTVWGSVFATPFWLVAYLVLFEWTRRRNSAVVGSALREAMPFALAVAATPMVLGGRYWPDAVARYLPVWIASVAASLGGALVLGASNFRIRPSLSVSASILVALAAIQLVLIVRGLPNPPVKTVSSGPVTIEYPEGHGDVADDVTAFRDVVAMLVRRSGIVLPPRGVYVRFRYAGGPKGPDAPADTIVVDLDGFKIDDLPELRPYDFSLAAARVFVPPPNPDDYNRRAPYDGYVRWLVGRDLPASRNLGVRSCEVFLSTPGAAFDAGDVPYVRAEMGGGVEAARALFARYWATRPTYKDWLATLKTECAALLVR